MLSMLAFAFIGGFLIFYNPKTVSNLSNPTQNNSNISNTPQIWESKIDEQSAVIVTVTPIDILPQSKEWKFNVVMDTHSIELDQDMVKVAVLVDDSGKEYSPNRWQGAPPGGHHREGLLIFTSITPYPQHLKLKIKDIDGAQRMFSWI